MKRYDAIIIGFGKGGKTLAADLAGRGKKVAVVEKSAGMYGGTCINVGCIPTKSLVNSARWSEIRRQGLAASLAEQAALYAEAMEEKYRLTGALREKNFQKFNQNPLVDVLNGTGSFVCP